MNVLFTALAWEDYTFWSKEDAKTVQRINALIEECRRHPFTGTGKPEPLRGNLKGWWSRRISREHRLVYRVIGKDEEKRIMVAQCRFHY